MICLTRKLLLLVVMALSAMALGAPAAFGAIEVKTEPNPGKHCSAVVTNDHVGSGGCGLHAVSTENIDLLVHNHMTGAESVLSICSNEFEARIGENGEGYIYNPVLTGVNCFVEPCREDEDGVPGNDHGPTELWPFHIEDLGPNTEWIEVRFCIEQLLSETEQPFCTLHILVIKLGHTYTFNAEPNAGCEELGDEREVEGRWTLENAGEGTHNRIEIVNT